MTRPSAPGPHGDEGLRGVQAPAKTGLHKASSLELGSKQVGVARSLAGRLGPSLSCRLSGVGGLAAVSGFLLGPREEVVSM